MSKKIPTSKTFAATAVVALMALLLPNVLIAQSQPVLIKEVISREVGIHVGGVQEPEIQEVFSREASIFVESGPSIAKSEVISREVSLAIGSADAPPPVTEIAITVSPSGDSVVLDWSAYPQWQIRDIAIFEIYLSDDGPFDNVSGLTPVATAGGGQTSITLDGLTPFTDHYLAIVAIDILGNKNPVVTYSAAYVLSPETLSREVSLFIGTEPEPPYAEVISREVSLVVATEAPPAAIAKIDITVSPSGDSAKLDWSNYNQWAERDIAKFEIYLSDDAAFTDISGLTPYLTVTSGTTMVTLDDLTPGTDHFFAIVPVDALGNANPLVEYAAAYVLSPEVISREVALFVGTDNADPYREIVSRETSILVPDDTVPAPVTGIDSGFFAETSSTEFGSVLLDWQSYNQFAQVDVVSYDIYVGGGFFDNVTGLTPFATVPAGTQRTNLLGLKGSEIFHFAVVARDVLGNFDPVVRSFSTQASISGVGEVGDLAATSTANSISLTWTAPPDAGTFLSGYQLFVSGEENPIEIEADQTAFLLENLDPATGYSLRLSTVDTFGNVSDGISLLGSTLLPNPTNLSLTAINGEVRLLWDPVEPASLVANYEIYRSNSPFTDISSRTPFTTSPGTSADLGPFAQVSGNHYAVAAVNVLGASDPNVVSIQAIKAAQTITFPALAAGPLQIPLEASASSGLAVTYSASPGRVATVQAAAGPASLLVHQGGTVNVIASQAGNDEFWPASETQSLRLPPVITEFTVNGVPITNATVITRERPTLAVAARDISGISQAEFFGRVAGDGSWNSLGIDNIPGDGLRVTLPAGTLPPGAYEVRVVVTAGAGFTSEKSETVKLSPQPVLAMSLGETLIEGQTLTGTVSVNSAPSADLAITLQSSRPGQINGGPPVIIPAGQTSVPFTIRGVQDVVIEDLVEVRLTASASGAISASAIVDLLDDDLPILVLSIDRPGASESAGANAALGRIEREPVTALPLTVTIENSDPAAVTIPTTVTIPGGRAAATFAIGTIDDDLNDGPQVAMLTAFAKLANGTIVSESDAVSFEVSDDEGPSLALSFDAEYLLEGTVGAITLTRNGASLESPLTVNLVADVPAELDLPATVEIPAGAESATFSASAVDDGVADGSIPVILNATAADFNPGQLSLLVTDEELPDLVPLLTDTPTAVASESEFQISYRLENQGAAATVPPSLQRVFLSTDPALGDDVLLTQLNFAAVLDPGVGFTRTATVRAPRESGTYWILVVADAVDSIAELSESNNVAFSATPLEVMPEYSATVATTVEEIPANNAIPLTGSATLASGAPAPHRLVNIHIRLGETERIIAAITGANGQFSTNWNPLPGEGGRYEIGATHPGIPTAPTQDSFTILTLETAFPESAITFDEGSSATFNASLTNPNESAFTGLEFSAPNLPEGLDFDFTLPVANLAPGAEMQIGVAATASAGYSGDSTVHVTLMSDQGLTLRIPVEVVVRPLFPRLVVAPESLNCSVLRGGQKTVTFAIENTGSLASGPVEMLLPNIPWLTPASPGVLPSIVPGGRIDVSLLLTPDDSVPLTRFDGNFILRPAEGSEVNVNFAFRVVSDLKGDLEISVVDEYFYFTEEAPKVNGATVVVRDAVSSKEIVRAQTGEDGLASFTGLAEGWYSIEVDSPNHTRYRENYFLNAGELNRKEIFISLELVTYNWTVEEVELQDRYRISVETTFETNVPAPVVTITPAVLDVEDLVTVGQSKIVNLVIKNNGFIAAEAAQFNFAEHPFYEIVPLIRDIGLIPAKSSLTVPVTLRRIGEFAADGSVRAIGQNDAARSSKDRNRAFVPCSIPGGIIYRYECGPNGVLKRVPVAVSGVRGYCLTGEVDSYVRDPNNDDGRRGTPRTTTVTFSTPTRCDCDQKDSKCIEGRLAFSVGDLAEELVDGLDSILPPWLDIDDPDLSVNVGGKLCRCCDTIFGFSGAIDGKAEVSVAIEVGLQGELEFDVPAGAGYTDLEIDGEVLLGLALPVSGFVGGKLEKDCDGKITSCVEGGIELKPFLGAKAQVEIEAKGPNGEELKGTALLSAGASGELFAGITGCEDDGGYRLTACIRDFAIGATLLGKLEGSTAGGAGASFEVNLQKNIYKLEEPKCLGDPKAVASQRGLKSRKKDEVPQEELPFVLLNPADYRMSDEQIREELEIESGSGVCAKVKLRIDQEAVMTRSAFKGTLELSNNIETSSLTAVGFDLDVRDADGQPADDVFNIRVTDFSGLEAIDGTGEIAALATGRAEWTLIPRDSAAPLEDTQYTIGGTITYDQAGTVFSIPVEPVAITVRPDASLFLKYFHQRDVFSDDPHTDPIEPSVPFSLAVLVENRGAGAARDLSITSAKPEIVDNEKGLFINFETIATEVAGQNLSPSLTANFGEIGPGERKIATWLHTSTLQGLFIDYEATFEHLDGFGDPRISLIKEVEIHEMNHLIEALGDKADGEPDFLVNDIADIDDRPDTVHFSNGGTAPVAFDDTAMVDAPLALDNLTITLDTGTATGWTYLRIPDPADGEFVLVSAVRSDGLVIPVERNIWTTDRTFIGLGRRPIYENILHLADCDSTGSYTLTYAPAPDADLLAPTSEVVMLPEQSGTAIPVTWTGEDAGGIAGYDLFVMVGDGPWMPWLTNTRQTSGIYEGTLGETYRFYSRATDFAGNRQAGDPAPQASTAVSLTNAAPVIVAVGDTTVAEGATFSLQVVAADPDGPDSALRYSVVDGPSGLVINNRSGAIRWITGENNGGLSEQVLIRVTDAGIPAAQSELSFEVKVLEINSPPVLVALEPAVLEPGESMIRRVSATDADFPEQVLTYTLADSAPDGMNIDASSGVISFTPNLDQAGKSFGVGVIATDNGSPLASSETTLSIRILDPTGTTTDLPIWSAILPQVWFAESINELPVLATLPDGKAVQISLGVGDLPAGISLVNPANDGSGVLRWDTVDVVPGIYQVPLKATSDGGMTEQFVSIRIVPRDFYWEWMVRETTGKDVDLGTLELRDDPDGDGRPNGFEMALFKDPFAADTLEFDCLVANRIDDQFLVLDLCFYRRKGSEDFVVIDPEYSDELGADGWKRWDWDWQAEVDPRGDEDNDPETEYVTIQVISPLIGPDVGDKRFYRLGLEFRD